MINLKEFAKRKDEELVVVVRITEDALAFSEKNFSSSTGEELPEIVTGGNLKEYKDKVVALRAELEGLEAFITSVELLKTQNKVEVIG